MRNSSKEKALLDLFFNTELKVKVPDALKLIKDYVDRFYIDRPEIEEVVDDWRE